MGHEDILNTDVQILDNKTVLLRDKPVPELHSSLLGEFALSDQQLNTRAIFL